MKNYKDKIVAFLSIVAVVQGVVLSTIYIKKEILPDNNYQIIFSSHIEQSKLDTFLVLDDSHGKDIQWETLQLVYPKLGLFDYFPIKAFHYPDMKISIRDILQGIHHQVQKRRTGRDGVISELLPVPMIIFGTFYKDGKVYKLRSRYSLTVKATYLNEAGLLINKKGYKLQLGNLSFEEHLGNGIDIVEQVDFITESFIEKFHRR